MQFKKPDEIQLWNGIHIKLMSNRKTSIKCIKKKSYFNAELLSGEVGLYVLINSTVKMLLIFDSHYNKLQLAKKSV